MDIVIHMIETVLHLKLKNRISNQSDVKEICGYVLHLSFIFQIRFVTVGKGPDWSLQTVTKGE